MNPAALPPARPARYEDCRPCRSHAVAPHWAEVVHELVLMLSIPAPRPTRRTGDAAEGVAALAVAVVGGHGLVFDDCEALAESLAEHGDPLSAARLAAAQLYDEDLPGLGDPLWVVRLYRAAADAAGADERRRDVERECVAAVRIPAEEELALGEWDDLDRLLDALEPVVAASHLDLGWWCRMKGRVAELRGDPGTALSLLRRSTSSLAAAGAADEPPAHDGSNDPCVAGGDAAAPGSSRVRAAAATAQLTREVTWRCVSAARHTVLLAARHGLPHPASTAVFGVIRLSALDDDPSPEAMANVAVWAGDLELAVDPAEALRRWRGGLRTILAHSATDPSERSDDDRPDQLDPATRGIIRSLSVRLMIAGRMLTLDPGAGEGAGQPDDAAEAIAEGSAAAWLACGGVLLVATDPLAPICRELRADLEAMSLVLALSGDEDARRAPALLRRAGAVASDQMCQVAAWRLDRLADLVAAGVQRSVAGLRQLHGYVE